MPMLNSSNYTALPNCFKLAVKLVFDKGKVSTLTLRVLHIMLCITSIAGLVLLHAHAPCITRDYVIPRVPYSSLHKRPRSLAASVLQ
jgi:hypothetical protein